MAERRAVVAQEPGGLSITRQCSLLGIARSSCYYRPVPPTQPWLSLLAAVDRLYTENPFYGGRRLRAVLARDHGIRVGRRRLRRAMRTLGLEAIYPRRRTSVPAPGHRIYPYLLRGLAVERPGQVWATDITYVRLDRGFVYLVAHLDWHSRYVLSWRLSTTMDVTFCLESLREALSLHGQPEIHNSDQGAQFTASTYVNALLAEGIRVSMDGRGRWADNVFIERLWRTVKYEYLFLREFATVGDVRHGLADFFWHYNERRPHQSLGYATPGAVFRGEVALAKQPKRSQTTNRSSPEHPTPSFWKLLMRM